MYILNLISQHAEESSFLWLLRDMAVNEPHYSLKDLAKLDTRIDAHIDGLRIAGDEGWEICKEELAREEPGEVFTASFLAFENGNEERINEVLKVGTQNWELARGIVSSLGWLPYPTSKKYIDKFLMDEISVLRQIGIAAAAVHRQITPQEFFMKALDDEDVFVKVRAFKAVGELGKIDYLKYLKKNFQDTNPLISFSAALSASVLGDSSAPFILKLFLV